MRQRMDGCKLKMRRSVQHAGGLLQHWWFLELLRWTVASAVCRSDTALALAVKCRHRHQSKPTVIAIATAIAIHQRRHDNNDPAGVHR